MPEGLETAIEDDDLVSVSQYLQSEVPVNSNIKNHLGQNAVIIAAKYEAVNVLPIFLDKNATYNSADTLGYTALHYAALYGNSDCIKLLQNKSNLRYKTKTSSEGKTALHLAVEEGHLEIVKLLLEKNKALKTIRTPDGLTPLHLACIRGDITIINEFNPSFKDLTRATTEDQDSPLHFAVRGTKDIKPRESRRTLIENLFDLFDEDYKKYLTTITNRAGDTIFMEAIHTRDLDTCKFLFSINDSIAGQNNFFGVTPLLLASKLNHGEIIDFLKRQKIKPC